MKVYRIIVIAVAIILGLFFSITILFTPNIQATIKEPVTEEYYDMLKENIALDLISKYSGLEVYMIEEIKSNLN